MSDKRDNYHAAMEERDSARRKASPRMDVGEELIVIDTPGTLPGINFIVARDGRDLLWAIDPEPLAQFEESE
jgi:hypothetical protein